jgi:hypothetical protein
MIITTFTDNTIITYYNDMMMIQIILYDIQ